MRRGRDEQLALIAARKALAQTLADVVAETGDCPFCAMPGDEHDRDWGDRGQLCPLGRYLAAKDVYESAVPAPRASGPK